MRRTWKLATALSGAAALAATALVALDSGPAIAEGLGTVTVAVEPSEAAEKALDAGDVQVNEAVPFQASLKPDGDVAITIYPADVPAQAFNPTGLVTFHVQRLTPAGLIGSTTLSLVRSSADPTRWIDPEDAASESSPNVRLRPHGFRTVRLDMPLRTVKGQRFSASARQAFSAGDDDIDPPPADTGGWTDVVSPGESNDLPSDERGVESCSLKSNGPVWTTIATSYPIDNNRSWLEYSGSMSTRSGTAATVGTGGNFRAEKTKTTSDGWGQDFAESPYNRSYRIEINYGIYLCVNTITGYSWYKTEPRFQTGGTDWAWLDPDNRPNWNSNCVNVANGVWHRWQEDGKSYALGYGVKFKDIIGIDLQSEHGYSNSARLNYRVDDLQKRMCGKEAVPSKAGKMILRWRP